MNARDLLEALAAAEGSPVLNLAKGAKGRVIADAARTIALPILEADPELVERLMAVLPRDPYNKDQDRSKRILAEKILAAISTPTPVEES